MRESWRSRTGFVLAAVGSAIGLANIVSFPYMVEQNGGAVFVMMYLASLALIGFPVFVSEVVIGRAAHSSPTGAFRLLGRNWAWTKTGTGVVLTGLIVSSFYSAVAGWILGYLVEALSGRLTSFDSVAGASGHYKALLASPAWGLSFHALFLGLCLFVLFGGVRSGIERASKVLMPLLFAVLLYLAIYGLTLPDAGTGLRYLFSPDWSEITTGAVLMALGQSFFTLSAGQGTMITYGSYLSKKDNLVSSCIPIVLADTLISLLAAVAVFTTLASTNVESTGGLDLVFNTLPVVFSRIPGGFLVAVLFFLLVTLAALTSEISAMEPMIAYLVDEHKWSRSRAVIVTGLSAFILGVPCALSANLMSGWAVFGKSILDAYIFLALNVLVPLGGLAAVLLVGWRWGMKSALTELGQGTGELFNRRPWVAVYFRFCIKYLAPALIVVVFVRALGLL